MFFKQQHIGNLKYPPEPAKKMRKVMVGAVEVMVEDGATLTIAGVPISFR